MTSPHTCQPHPVTKICALDHRHIPGCWNDYCKGCLPCGKPEHEAGHVVA